MVKVVVGFGGEVAGAAATNVVDGSGVLAQALLLGELLVEAEHGALLLAVHVAGAAAAGGEEGVGGWWGQLDARGGSRGGWPCGEGRVRDACLVSGAAAAVVDGCAGLGDGGVGLGDVVGEGHFGGLESGGVGVLWC